MKIINNTDLSYSSIGLLMDNVIEKSIGDTIYYGKIDILNINFACREIKIQIRYLKKYVEWRFDYKDLGGK